jgi:hypothetical protein
MRQFNPDNAQEIRKRREYPSDSCCGAILLRGMPHEFCYNRFGEWIRTNLRHSMDKRLLNRMVRFAAANSNFSRIQNQDLRSVVRHARVSFPYDPTSDFSIPGIPDV